jgi:dTDP-4-dehydrorhamnose reductase
LQNIYNITFVDRNECDITQFESVKNCIWEYKPDIVVNCAAYTAVDDAEDIGKMTCYEVNTIGSYNIAKATMQV